VSERLRIGEVLLLREAIDPWLLSRTLREQTSGGQRLVSTLIAHAHLDPDDGALALSEQLGYPAMLQRHFERRDPDVLSAIPAGLGQRWGVVAIGRARDGGIVACAKTPTPILAAALEHACKLPVALSVAPAIQLDRLVRAVYGDPAPDAKFETPPSIADIGDVRVGEHRPSLRRARSVSDLFVSTGPGRAPVRMHSTQTFDEVLDEIDRAITRAAADRYVMAYAARRWRAALLMRISDGKAVGFRGHGAQLVAVDAVSLELSGGSLVAQAYVTRDLATSAGSDELARLLGEARSPIAAPIAIADRVEAILAVGDPHLGDERDAKKELARLVDALGAAYARGERVR